MAVNIGPRIGIDGEAEYRKELNNIIQQAKTLSSEMKAVTASFDKNTSAAKKNAAQAEELSKQIKVQEERVKKLSDMVDKSAEKTGESSTTTLKWKEALNDANAELYTMQQRLTDMKVPTQDWGQALQETGEKLQKIGSKMSEIGKTLTTHITLPVVAAGAAAVSAASDYEENLNKINVAFEDSAGYVAAWAETATASFGLSKNSALEAAALFGDMATSMGFTRDEAAKMSTELAGLAGDLASFKNISTDQAMNALKSVFTGETESLKNLGVVMTQTNLEAFAESQGKVYTAASETEKAFIRYQYVLERTQNAQGDYSETSDGFANSLRTLKESTENLAIVFGEVLLPVVTPVIQGLTDMVTALSELPEPVKNTIVTVGLLAAAVGPILVGLGKGLLLISQLSTALPALTGGLGAAAGGAGVLAGAASGVGVALAVAAAAVAVFVGTLKALEWIDEHQEEIKAFFSGLASSAKDGCEKAVDGIVALDTTINNWVDETAEKAKNFGLDMIQNVADGITEAKDRIVEALTSAIDGAIEKARSAVEKVNGWGREIVDGLASGMDQAQGKLQNAASRTAGSISAYLHFSKPDVGPLASIDKWMPDMMNLLSTGMISNLGQLEQAANLTANTIYMPIGGNEEIAEGINRMNSALSERETPVNVNVTLQGGAERFFKEVVQVNNRRTMSTGYNQLAAR